MKLRKSILIAFFSFVYSILSATTWDEPWADQVIKESESFVLARVKSTHPVKGIKIEIIKTLGGTPLSGEIEITDFYLLKLCNSTSGEGAEFHFENIKESYFFIKKNSKAKYCIATPTAGFDLLNKGKVTATYRHSYHQALVPQNVYEKTMTAIFNNSHGLEFDKNFIHEYVNTWLSIKPAGFAKPDTFFAQHVALECIHYLHRPEFYEMILPFLNDTSNFHNQVSAARALSAYDTKQSKSVLLNMIRDTTVSHFVQVICIWTLAEFNPVELKEQLIQLKKNASSKETGFGGDIMDPRVCTYFPEVRRALEKLIIRL